METWDHRMVSEDMLIRPEGWGHQCQVKSVGVLFIVQMNVICKLLSLKHNHLAPK